LRCAKARKTIRAKANKWMSIAWPGILESRNRGRRSNTILTAEQNAHVCLDQQISSGRMVWACDPKGAVPERSGAVSIGR